MTAGALCTGPAPKNLGEYLHGRYPPLNAPPGGLPRWRPVLGLLFSDSFVPQLKPLLTHFKNSLALVPSFSLSILSVSDCGSFSYEIFHHLSVHSRGFYYSWIASSLASVLRSLSRLASKLSTQVMKFILTVCLSPDISSSPPTFLFSWLKSTHKLSKDLTQTNKHNLAKLKICQTYSRGAILDSNSDTKFGFQV